MSDVVPSIAVSRDIAASCEAIFAVVSNPAMHPLLDGTGMAQRAENVPITRVGDVFVMHMTHWRLGNYGMENHVIEFEMNRRIVWEPRRHVYQDSEFPGTPGVPETRYWGWSLEPLGENLTRVTEFFDGSRLSEQLRGFLEDGEFWRLGMVTSLENLDRVVTAKKIPSPPEDAHTSLPPRNYFEEVQRAR